MAIYELASDHIQPMIETTFETARAKERTDLQRPFRDQIEIISPDTLVIAEEYGEWEDSRRRIDLLGVDRDANVVVIELKCTGDGGHMDLQAIRYAAMVSTMTFQDAVDAYGRFLRSNARDEDPRAAILEFLGWDEPDDDQFAQDVRIVLVSADFSRELTTSVLWLNERDLDIRCVRIKPYNHNSGLLVDVRKAALPREASDRCYWIEMCHTWKRRHESHRHPTRYAWGFLALRGDLGA